MEQERKPADTSDGPARRSTVEGDAARGQGEHRGQPEGAGTWGEKAGGDAWSWSLPIKKHDADEQSELLLFERRGGGLP